MILGALLGKGVPNVSIVKRADYAMGYYPVINIKVRHDAVGFLEALERALLQQDIESTIKTEVRHKKSTHFGDYKKEKHLKVGRIFRKAFN